MSAGSIAALFQGYQIRIDAEFKRTYAEMLEEDGISPDALLSEWEAFTMDPAHRERDLVLTADVLEELRRRTKKQRGSQVKREPEAPGLPSSPVLDRRSVERFAATAQLPPSTKQVHLTPSKASQDIQRGTQAFNAHLTSSFAAQKPAQGVHISIVPLEATASPYQFAYTLDNMQEVKASLRDHTQRLINSIVGEINSAQEEGEEGVELHPLSRPAQGSVYIGGRLLPPEAITSAIKPESGTHSGDARLDLQSLIMEAPNGERTLLDLQDVPTFAIHPGLVVVAQGTNPTGRVFQASRLFLGSAPPAPPQQTVPSAPAVKVVTVCGPFCHKEAADLDFLGQIVNQIQQKDPDVVMMMGPFVDVQNLRIQRAEINGTFEEAFREAVQVVVDCTKDSTASVVFVPSLRDAHHEYVFPQHAFEDVLAGQHVPQGKYVFAPNPSLLNVELCDRSNVLIGISSEDVLMDLSRTEVAKAAGPRDRLAELASKLVLQRSFYPLYPPPPHSNVNLEPSQFDRIALPVLPDLLVCPSALQPFACASHRTTFVNPGRAVKGTAAGTLAEVTLFPSQGRPSSECRVDLLPVLQ